MEPPDWRASNAERKSTAVFSRQGGGKSCCQLPSPQLCYEVYRRRLRNVSPLAIRNVPSRYA
jgi:hypothetical protein